MNDGDEDVAHRTAENPILKIWYRALRIHLREVLEKFRPIILGGDFMSDSALSILQREGEQRGASGHVPDTHDFDEHVAFYKSVMRFTRMFLVCMAVLLLGMYFFLVR
jgi:hypothetical protein